LPQQKGIYRICQEAENIFAIKKLNLRTSVFTKVRFGTFGQKIGEHF
jgi:hypothetical protein